MNNELIIKKYFVPLHAILTKMNQVARTFVLIGMIVIILLALHFLPKLTIGETELRRVNVLSDVLPEVHEDDLDAVPEIPDVPQPVTVVPVSRDSMGTVQAQAGSLPADSALATMPMPEGVAGEQGAEGTVQVAVTDSVAPGVTPILDYSQGRAGGMYHFYQALASARSMGRPVRVAYYGDSFIEGDIFTADLRELLQDQFGGNGVGWVDCASQVNGFRTTVTHNYSGIHEYEVVKRPFSASNQGIAQRYFTANDGARMTYKGTRAKKHLSQWDRAIFYLRTGGGLTLRTTMNGDTTVVDTVGGSQNLQAIVRRYERTEVQQSDDSTIVEPTIKKVAAPMTSVSYQVAGIGSGTLLYGVALEPVTGVVVDNFSMRGSAGFTLSQIPAATLAQFAVQRPYDLIVVHYGLNVANSHQGNYSGYTKQMGQAIDHLHQAYPQASILVVSMPDRDQRTDAGLRTMRGVEQLVAYQQIMASDHGVSFFNLFQAMGGRESMKTLVDRGLANKDYTHINFRGGRHLARLLFDALMAGYHSYGF